MTKDKALHSYLEAFMQQEFGKEHAVYLKERVPDEALLPYLAYEFVDNSFLDGDVFPTVELWHHTDNVAYMNEKARAFRKYIETNDMINCDEGYIWVKPGTPFAQTIPGQEMVGLIGKVINLTIEYFTE